MLTSKLTRFLICEQKQLPRDTSNKTTRLLLVKPEKQTTKQKPSARSEENTLQIIERKRKQTNKRVTNLEAEQRCRRARRPHPHCTNSASAAGQTQSRRAAGARFHSRQYPRSPFSLVPEAAPFRVSFRVSFLEPSQLPSLPSLLLLLLLLLLGVAFSWRRSERPAQSQKFWLE